MEIHGDLNCHNSKAHKIALLILNFPLIWSATGMFWFPKGVNYVPPLVIAAFISSFFVFGFKGVLRHLKTNLFALLVFAISAYSIFQYQYHGGGSREMRAWITCLFFIVCFNKKAFKDSHFFLLVSIASCGVLTTAALQTFYFSVSRAHGYLNPNVYAIYSASIAIMCFCLFLKDKKNKFGIFYFSLFVLLIMSTLLTGSRGVWLALLSSIIIITGIAFKDQLFRRKKVIAIVFLTSIALIVLLYPFFDHRIKKTLNEIEQITSGRMDNNIGIRLQLWSAGMELSKISPVIGLGDSHSVELRKLFEENKIGIKALRQPHYHNNYLDVLVKRGGIGLILLLMLLVFPMMVFRRGVCQQWRKNISFCLFIVYSISGLTDVPLNHDTTIYFYVFFVSAITPPIPMSS